MAYLNGFAPAHFTVPQDPIGMRGLGFETGDYIPAGVTNFLSSSSISDSIAGATGINAIPALPNWGVLLGLGVVVWFVTQPSGGSYRGERKKLRAKYAGYRQVTRKTGGFLSSI